MAPKKLLIAAAVLLAACAPSARACLGTPQVVSGSYLTAKPVDNSTAYKMSGVQQHYVHLAPINDYRSNVKSTFSCVDSRGAEPMLGAFGGDFGELAAGIAAYYKATNAKPTEEGVAAIFKAFMATVASPERPFYYHSSHEKLLGVFEAVAKAGVRPEPVILPDTMPAEVNAQKIWMKELSKGKAQGCGHVRLMIDQHEDYGLDSPIVPQALIKAFYNYFWSTPVDSPQRARVRFVLKPGALQGRAVTIVTTAGDACKGESPAVAGFKDGSQVFVFHPEAVTDFRKAVLTPFFVDYAKSQGKTLSPSAYLSTLEALQKTMTGATLKLLSPANALPQWTVKITAAPDTPGSAASNGRPTSAVKLMPAARVAPPSKSAAEAP